MPQIAFVACLLWLPQRRWSYFGLTWGSACVLVLETAAVVTMGLDRPRQDDASAAYVFLPILGSIMGGSMYYACSAPSSLLLVLLPVAYALAVLGLALASPGIATSMWLLSHFMRVFLVCVAVSIGIGLSTMVNATYWR